VEDKRLLVVDGEFGAALKAAQREGVGPYAPAYDLPCTLIQWRRQLRKLPSAEILSTGSGGQGNVGVVRRVPSQLG
jgi:hypothetical protein